MEDAVANNQTKQSRIEHIVDKLRNHLPEPVAATLAETLMENVENDETNNNNNNNDIDFDSSMPTIRKQKSDGNKSI